LRGKTTPTPQWEECGAEELRGRSTTWLIQDNGEEIKGTLDPAARSLHLGYRRLAAL
jgi:hypothetical protein